MSGDESRAGIKTPTAEQQELQELRRHKKALELENEELIAALKGIRLILRGSLDRVRRPRLLFPEDLNVEERRSMGM